MFNGFPKHCRARCATPHGVVGAAASPTATEREPLTGFGCGRERPRATEMEALTGLGGIRKRAHHRFAEIDDDIRKAEALLRHNLSFRGLLRP